MEIKRINHRKEKSMTPISFDLLYFDRCQKKAEYILKRW